MPKSAAFARIKAQVLALTAAIPPGLSQCPFEPSDAPLSMGEPEWCAILSKTY